MWESLIKTTEGTAYWDSVLPEGILHHLIIAIPIAPQPDPTLP